MPCLAGCPAGASHRRARRTAPTAQPETFLGSRPRFPAAICTSPGDALRERPVPAPRRSRPASPSPKSVRATSSSASPIADRKSARVPSPSGRRETWRAARADPVGKVPQGRAVDRRLGRLLPECRLRPGRLRAMIRLDLSRIAIPRQGSRSWNRLRSSTWQQHREANHERNRVEEVSHGRKPCN